MSLGHEKILDTRPLRIKFVLPIALEVKGTDSHQSGVLPHTPRWQHVNNLLVGLVT